MDNNRNNLNKREVFMGHAYVFLFFIITTVICCISIFMWNSDFSMFEQKEFVKALIPQHYYKIFFLST